MVYSKTERKQANKAKKRLPNGTQNYPPPKRKSKNIRPS